MAVSPEGSKNSFVDCSLCSKPVVDPRIISCHHSFCYACIINHCPLTTDDQGRQTSSCPECRQPFEVPSGGLKNLRKNEFLDRFRSCYITSMLCEVCCKDLVEYRCEECKEHFCGKCFGYHARFKATRAHRPSRVEERTLNEYLICQQHSKDVDMFCNLCSTFGCIVCHSEQHNGHAFLLIKDKFEAVKQQLSDSLSAKQQIHTTVLDKVRSCKELCEKSRKTLGDLKIQVSTAGENLMAVVRDQVNQLCVTLDNKHEIYLNMVNSEIQNLENLKTTLQEKIWNYEESLCSLNFRTVTKYGSPAAEEPDPQVPDFSKEFAPTFEPNAEAHGLLAQGVVGKISDGAEN